MLPIVKRKIRNAPRPSEHPPVRGEKMSKRLGGIKGCKYKTSSVLQSGGYRFVGAGTYGKHGRLVSVARENGPSELLFLQTCPREELHALEGFDNTEVHLFRFDRAEDCLERRLLLLLPVCIPVSLYFIYSISLRKLNY